jgi:hypothetical protein
MFSQALLSTSYVIPFLFLIFLVQVNHLVKKHNLGIEKFQYLGSSKQFSENVFHTTLKGVVNQLYGQIAFDGNFQAIRYSCNAMCVIIQCFVKVEQVF